MPSGKEVKMIYLIFVILLIIIDFYCLKMLYYNFKILRIIKLFEKDREIKIKENIYQYDEEFLKWENKLKKELISEKLSKHFRNYKSEYKLYTILKEYEEWRNNQVKTE